MMCMNDQYSSKNNFSPILFAKSVATDTVIYGVASILSRSVSLLSFPLLARFYSVENYGLIDLLYLATNLLTTFLILGQESAIFRFFHVDNCNQKRCQMITGSLTFQLILSTVVTFILWIIKQLFQENFGISNHVNYLIDIVLLTAPFGVIYANAQAILRLTFKRIQFLILSIGFTIANLIIVFISTLIFKPEIVLLFQLHLVVWILFGVLSLWYIREWIIFPKRPLVSRKMISYGVPMGLITLIGVVQPFVERIVVNQEVNLEALGLYAAAAKISLLVTLIVGAFQSAFSPFLMSSYQSENVIKSYNFLLKLYMIGLSCVVLTLAAYGDSILLLMGGEKYIKGAIVIFPVALSIFIKSIGIIIGTGIILSNKTYLKLIIYIISLFISISMMIIFGGTYGIVGIAFGTIVGNLVMLILEAYFGQVLWPMQWEFLVVPVMIILTSILGYWLTSVGSGTVFELASLIFALSILLLVSLSIFNKDEKNLLMSYLLKKSESLKV